MLDPVPFEAGFGTLPNNRNVNFVESCHLHWDANQMMTPSVGLKPSPPIIASWSKQEKCQKAYFAHSLHTG